MLPIVDANVILRYLLDDVPEQSAAARKVVEDGCEVTVEVLAEVVYVLKGVYEIPRDTIADTVTALLDTVYIDRHDEMIAALELFAKKNLDFIDCVLAAQHLVSGREVVSFDKKLEKLLK